MSDEERMKRGDQVAIVFSDDGDDDPDLPESTGIVSHPGITQVAIGVQSLDGPFTISVPSGWVKEIAPGVWRLVLRGFRS